MHFRSENFEADAPALQPVPPTASQQQSNLPYGATLNPLQIHPLSQPSRPPTMSEVEVIMRHFQQINDKQSHEVIYNFYLKTGMIFYYDLLISLHGKSCH